MQISGVAGAMRNALTSMQEGAFQKAGYVLNKNKDAVREEIQRQTADNIKQVIANLRNNKAISPRDKDMIKLWILGDAESYTMMENNFHDWINEYKRLLGVLESMERDSGSLQTLFKAQGVIEDASRVSYDIANYLEKKERIERFKNTFDHNAELDKPLRDALADILTVKLTSPDQ